MVLDSDWRRHAGSLPSHVNESPAQTERIQFAELDRTDLVAVEAGEGRDPEKLDRTGGPASTKSIMRARRPFTACFAGSFFEIVLPATRSALSPNRQVSARDSVPLLPCFDRLRAHLIA
jgi:hypothetical protein